MLSSTHPHMRRQGANLGGWERPEVMQEAQAGRTNGRKEDLTRLLTLADEACKRLDMLNGTKGARGGRGEGSSPAPSVNGQNDPPRLHTRAVSARAAPRVPTTRVPADAPASGSAVATTEDVAATVQQPVATVSRKRIRSADDVAAASVTDRINAASLAPRKVTAKRVESACECIHAENHFNWCEHAEQACTDFRAIWPNIDSHAHVMMFGQKRQRNEGMAIALSRLLGRELDRKIISSHKQVTEGRDKSQSKGNGRAAFNSDRRITDAEAMQELAWFSGFNSPEELASASPSARDRELWCKDGVRHQSSRGPSGGCAFSRLDTASSKDEPGFSAPTMTHKRRKMGSMPAEVARAGETE